ncbi:uncharacterized protein NECHADRAFT_80333 [Fusarium vanettenii 77-13-4]|uniref:DUF6594 domain-containing protein n=1 Tax=Fusarium vanettenii (strain ATCC MYA-4622 / CBS 123669 / FGSC 9596 / NRRL 45880 / 77-13-4) TaxID=660122 RepID=C7YRB5_FUSV7|nr:uncharacterized protein NECHADRAFT_80333 [Fusarium vanettenii 77-13-4]EEU45428.1 hypothetical protein NECHADRAFT_80333 [Fusarium vanettenii 77-13-4]
MLNAPSTPRNLEMSPRTSIGGWVSSEAQHGSTTQTQASTTVETPPSEEEINLKPWKFIGYKGYAEFISSDDDWFILRRFGTLNIRVALALQDEVSVLEEKLKKLDATYSQRGAPDRHNGRLRGDVEERRALIELLSDKLYKYTQEEQEYLQHGKDLICVAQKDKTPLRRLIDSSLTIRTLPIWRHKDKAVPNYDAEHVSYYSDSRMDKFASAVIAIIGVVMLITPIWVLQAMDGLKAKLGVITAFVLIFLLTLSFAMASKPFEALGATAAYAAVLMVFTQLGTPDR